METLRSLITKHPEWADLPITVNVWGSSTGDIAYVGEDGTVCVDVDDNLETGHGDGTKILHFSASIV